MMTTTSKRKTVPRASKSGATPTAGGRIGTVEKRGRAGGRPGTSAAFETVLVDISTRFIGLPADRMDREIVLSLQRVCESLGLDVCALWQFSPDHPENWSMTHVFIPSDFPPVSPETTDAQKSFPWCLQSLLKKRTIVLSRIADAPAAASRDVASWTQYGLKSVLTLPLFVGDGPVFGALSFNTVRKERVWSPALVEKLGKVARIFASALSRKIVEDHLRSSEERFRALAESALVGIYILQDGRYVYVNPAMARVFGYSVAEMTGMTPRDIVQPSDLGMVGENIRRRIVGEVPAMQYEVKGRYRDGSTRDVEVYGSRVDINGRPALIGTLIDVTERKRAEEGQAKSRELLTETERIGKVGGWEIDLRTMTLTWTSEIFSIFEVEPTFEPTVEKAIQFYAPASKPQIERLVRRAIEQGEPYEAELEIVTARGRLRTVYSIGKVDPEHHRVYGFFQDVTDRKEAELALAESEERYRTLFESAPAGMLVIGEDGTVRAANSLQARLYGYESPEQLRGLYAPHFVAERDRERSAQNMRSLLEGRELPERTYTAVRRDGSEFTAEVTSIPLRGPAQDLQGYLCITRDITKDKQDENERVELRHELAHLARVMAMNELSTSLAHEINQPLGAILNNAQAARSLLARVEGEGGEFREIVEDIIQDALRAGDVVRKIRGLVKKSEVRFEPLSLNVLIEDVVRLVRNSLALNGATLRLDLAPDLANVRGDRVRLQQILMNLMTNAIDAVKNAPSRVLEVRTAMPAADTVVVSIRDSGKGLSQTDLDNAFKPFFTTKTEGLGMGLTICRAIIEEHGGRIWGENNPAGGATFSFSLNAWPGGPVPEPGT